MSAMLLFLANSVRCNFASSGLLTFLIVVHHVALIALMHLVRSNTMKVVMHFLQ